MILYRYTADCSGMNLKDKDMDKDSCNKFYSRRGLVPVINSKFYTSFSVEKKYWIAITDIIRDRMTIVFAYGFESDICEAEDSIRTNLPDIRIIKREEITLEEFGRELIKAERVEWLERGKNATFNELKLKVEPDNYSFFDGAPYRITERIYTPDEATKKITMSRLSDILASDSFYEEINRIYSNENERRFLGHPVHYLITAGDIGATDDMLDILIPALMKNKRLLSGRVCIIDNIKPRAYKEENFSNIFPSMRGGTVVINLTGDVDNGMYATGYHELAERLGKKLGEFGNDTLFVFVDVSGKSAISNDTIAAILANADMVQINEGHGDLKRAASYLKRLAAKTEYDDYKIEDLTGYLPNDKDTYSVSEIFSAFNKWYGRGLKTHIYKAYKEKDIIKIDLKKKVDKPYEQLQRMIGLADVKKVTDEILAVAKMQKMRKEMGFPDTSASMHMLFSGNPGTAKTTVARLLAQILKEEDILSNGHIVECGRQDLVGKYVGWTAKIVEEKFQAARGGILFIDEAYSLVEDSRTYGAEAINTIVQEMENYRTETIVIFAGYPGKMEEFLEQNEGLASRIAFHLNFPDYTPDELVQIMDLMLERMGYSIDDKTRNKCYGIYADASRNENYGNGRFVRNTVEHAIMRQADRILRGSQEPEITKESANRLTADDFELIGIKKQTGRTIGFDC